MPSDPTLWMLFLVLCALVLGLTLWLGRGLSVRRTKDEFSLEVKERPAETSARPPDVTRGTVTVAKGLEGEDLAVGDVTGVQSGGEESRDVDVLSGAKLKHARVGDITGVRQTGSASKDRP